MKFRIKITRKMVIQMVFFAALTGIAMIVDFYLENNPEAIKGFNTCSEAQEKEQGVVYLFSQTINFNAKSSVQKISYRKFFAHEHDKFIRQCHQIRDHLALKAENNLPRKPLYLSCRNLIFRQNYFTMPDDEPLIS